MTHTTSSASASTSSSRHVALVGSTIAFFVLGARQRRLTERVPRNQLAAVPADGARPLGSDDGGDPSAPTTTGAIPLTTSDELVDS